MAFPEGVLMNLKGYAKFICTEKKYTMQLLPQYLIADRIGLTLGYIFKQAHL